MPQDQKTSLVDWSSLRDALASNPLLSSATAVAGAGVVSYAVYQVTWYWRHRKYNLPPGTFGWPLIGETFERFLDEEYFLKKYKKHGPVFISNYAGIHSVQFGTPEYIKWFKKQEKEGAFVAEEYMVWELVGKHNMLNMVNKEQEQEHTQARSTVLRTLSPKQIRSRFDDFANIFTKKLDEWAQAEILHKFEVETAAFTFDIGMSLLFGKTSESDRRTARELYDCFWAGIQSPNQFYSLPGTTLARAFSAKQKLIDHFLDLARASKDNVNGDNPCVIDQFRLQLESDVAEDTVETFIREQMILLIIASHETTARAIGETVFYSHKYRDRVAEFREAISRDFPPDVPLDYDKVTSHPHVQAMVKEVLRISAIAIEHGRMARRDLKFGEYDIPAGWTVLFNQTVYNQFDSGAWDRPADFDPSRHLTFVTQNGLRNDTRWVPFGFGRHECVGKYVALLELSLFVVLFFRDYDAVVDDSTVTLTHIPTQGHNFACTFNRVG